MWVCTKPEHTAVTVFPSSWTNLAGVIVIALRADFDAW